MLVSVDEIEKAELASIGEKTQALSSAPSQYLEVKNSMHILVYHKKEIMPSHISTKLLANIMMEKERTPVQTYQEASLAPIPQI